MRWHVFAIVWTKWASDNNFPYLIPNLSLTTTQFHSIKSFTPYLCITVRSNLVMYKINFILYWTKRNYRLKCWLKYYLKWRFRWRSRLSCLRSLITWWDGYKKCRKSDNERQMYVGSKWVASLRHEEGNCNEDNTNLLSKWIIKNNYFCTVCTPRTRAFHFGQFFCNSVKQGREISTFEIWGGRQQEMPKFDFSF